MMQSLVQRLVERLGLSDVQAEEAVMMIINGLKDRLPAALAVYVDRVMLTELDAGASAAQQRLQPCLANLGGLFGGQLRYSARASSQPSSSVSG